MMRRTTLMVCFPDQSDSNMSTVTNGVDVRAKEERQNTNNYTGDTSFKLRAALTSFSHRCLQPQARSGEATVVNERLHPSFFLHRMIDCNWEVTRRKVRVGKGTAQHTTRTRPGRWLKGATLTTFKPSNTTTGVHVWRKNHWHDSEADADMRVAQLRPSCGRKAFNPQRFEWNAPALENTCTE